MRWRRIKGVMLQNLFIMLHSPFRMMELLYWPLLELVLWGFISSYLARRGADILGGVTILLGAVLLWEIMHRSQQELSVTHMIDMWDRNILNIYASPLRQSEYFIGALIFSVGRVLVGSTVLAVVARLAFGFNILSAGAVLMPAFLVLMGMGWVVGLVIRAAIMRFGTNAEVLAWSLVFLLQPVSAVFYPVAVLPEPLEAIAAAIPAAHVFEALRAYFATGEVLAADLWVGAALDVVYLAAAARLAGAAFTAVRKRGLLSRPGY